MPRQVQAVETREACGVSLSLDLQFIKQTEWKNVKSREYFTVYINALQERMRVGGGE